jgi:putative ATP-dependent endonuclease of the OLD family
MPISTKVTALDPFTYDWILKTRPTAVSNSNTSTAQYNLKAYDHVGNHVRGFNNDNRGQLAFAYVDAGRSFDRQFGTSHFTLFGQAIRHLHNDLRGADQGQTLANLKHTLEKAHDFLRTDLYKIFETSLRDAFTAQLKASRYDVQFEFRILDETNLYRGLYPTLIDRGESRAPNEVGSGVRNLLVLALFHAFSNAFKGGAVLGIEEPELYLHPHAQRSLMEQFEGIVVAGNQLFISSHSAIFLDIARSDRIVLVERCDDEQQSFCTQVHTVTAETLLNARKKLHPSLPMTVQSVRAFLRNVRTTEMAEAFYSRLVIIVEGASEREALPLLCAALGLKFDSEGISVAASGGKTVIDTLVQLYQAHKIKTYVIFDNDKGKTSDERAYNKVICRVLEIPETDLPAPQIRAGFGDLHRGQTLKSGEH